MQIRIFGRHGHKTALIGALLILSSMPIRANETIVMLRHAEKPQAGLGQLSCQGLNRALKLPSVLLSKFGKPDAIYAPNPGVMKADRGVEYNYIRPLATIEPTAIAAGLPVNAKIGFNDINQLTTDLMNSQYRDATVFVVWEHGLLDIVAKDIIEKFGGNAEEIPKWNDDDFDGLYVITVEAGPDMAPKVSFHTDGEGLNGGSKVCPNSDAGAAH